MWEGVGIKAHLGAFTQVQGGIPTGWQQREALELEVLGFAKDWMCEVLGN